MSALPGVPVGLADDVHHDVGQLHVGPRPPGHVAGRVDRQRVGVRPHLSRNELITRVPHRNRYTLTPDGLRFAVFYTKVHDRLLRPLITADQPQAPPELRDALRAIDRHLSQRIAAAGLPAAA